MSEKRQARSLAYFAAKADRERLVREAASRVAKKAAQRAANKAKRLAWEIGAHEAELARQRLHHFASLGLPPPAPGHIVLLARRHKKSQPAAVTAG